MTFTNGTLSHLSDEQIAQADKLHPVDAMIAFGAVLSPEREAELRAIWEEPMSDVQWLLDDFQDDCERIQRVAREHGVTVTLEECATVWHARSQEVFANWLVMPRDDETLWRDTFAPKVITRVMDDGLQTKDGAA